MAKKSDDKIAIPFLSTKTKSKEVPKLSVKGLEKLAASMRKRNSEIESLSAEQKLDEKTVIDLVKVERIGAEKKGAFYKTCLVESEDNFPVKVTFNNKFQKIQTQHEPELRKVLGKLFDDLYVMRTDVKLRETTSVEVLKQILGDKFDALFETDVSICHRDEFMENRAKLRLSLDDKTNTVIDMLTDQVQAKPSVSFK